MRYQFNKPSAKKIFGNPVLRTPPGIKLLIMINIVVFLVVEVSGLKYPLFKSFGIVPAEVWSQFRIWQLFTYLFLHSGFWHIFINMFVLWMFGRELESRWGKKEFFRFYFLTGSGAGLVTVLFNFNSQIPVVGASGAIYGVLLAFGLLYPNREVLLYFFIPIKMKYFIGILAGVAFFASLSPGESPISHLTHLSGMIIGYLYLRSGLRYKSLKLWYLTQKLKHNKPKSKPKVTKPNIDETLLARRINEILDKLKMDGWDGLSESEKNILFHASKKNHQNQQPN